MVLSLPSSPHFFLFVSAFLPLRLHRRPAGTRVGAPLSPPHHSRLHCGIRVLQRFRSPSRHCLGLARRKSVDQIFDSLEEESQISHKGRMVEEEQEIRTSHSEGGESEGNDEKRKIRKNKLKKRLLNEASKADKRGVCYLSRIPPHMDHVKLRHILSQYGEIQRIYLAPEDPAAQVHRKRAGGFRGQVFSEGWVEFTKKTVAKRVANMLNGEQIGGRKRSSFYYDLWNIKYLSKFKWDYLTEEIAYKSAIREQKLALELSAAKRERDFYLSKVDKAQALSSIEERLKKNYLLRSNA